jgi:hypothetical protein
MAHARAVGAPGRGATRGFFLFLSCSALSCGAPAGARTPSAAGDPAKPVAAPVFTGELDRLPRYRSKRLALSLPLPDGSGWRIDDHSAPELVATHAATRSRVLVAVFRANEPVGRTQCEELARARDLLPPEPMRTLDDEVAMTQETFDTRIRVALRPGSGPAQPVVGDVIAIGGFLRKCYVFDFSTEVTGADGEPALSSRLAFARTRILGGLSLDTFGAVPRAEPGGPDPEAPR